MAAQTPEARSAIDAQILAEAQAMAKQGIVTMELPAVLAVGRKP